MEKSEPSYAVLENVKWLQLRWRTVWRFLKKPKIELLCDPKIPLLGTYLEKTIIQKGNDNPFQYSRLENPVDRGAWGATVHGVAKSWTQVSAHTCKKIHAPQYSSQHYLQESRHGNNINVHQERTG